MRIRFRAIDVASQAAVDAVRSALSSASLEVSDDGPGVLVFEDATPDVCDALREWSASGDQRVLALGLGEEALTAGARWRLLEAGAGDVLSWDPTARTEAAVAARLERWDAVDRLVRSPTVQGNLVGASPAWMALLRQVVEVAAFTDASVLVMGESGTGKELIARLVHTLDARREKRELMILDCAALVPELAGSEFFGHERGAYTGSAGARDGAFALADGGTLFLDEVGELPPALQAQLLRVVQERSFKRLGGSSWQRTSFRLVCATNKDLPREVERGQFRRDLYHRIASWVVRTPPLHERRDDILLLARHVAREQGLDVELDPGVREYLLRRPYAGNVRDLKHLVTRMCQRHVGPGAITVGDIPDDELAAAAGMAEFRDRSLEQAVRRSLALGAGLRDITREASETAIRLVVSEEEGNLQRAARRLGVTDRALQMRRARPPRRAEPSQDAPDSEAS